MRSNLRDLCIDYFQCNFLCNLKMDIQEPTKFVRVYDYTESGYVHFVRKVQVKSRVECDECFAVFPKCLYLDSEKRCEVCGGKVKQFS